jgi:nucleoside-triphosphatase
VKLLAPSQKLFIKEFQGIEIICRNWYDSGMKCNKLNILITGKPRTGKTTLIKRLVENLRYIDAGGFYTEEIIQNNTRTGFKIVTLDGKEGILAKKGMPSPFRLGKYGIDTHDLEEIGVKAIEQAIEEKDLVVIDEIAKMELFSLRFREVVIKALDCPKPVLGVIQMSNHPFLNRTRSRKDVKIHELMIHNRESLFQILVTALF